MSSKKYLVGVYDDEQVLMKAVGEVKKAGPKIYDVFTPFPVHGLEKVMGIKDSRLPIAAFIYGTIGLFLAILMQSWMSAVDWPMDIGGKPTLGASFVPICFELTVFCCCHGMALTFLLVSGLLPVMETKVWHPRATDDRFLIVFDTEEVGDVKKASDLLKKTGAVEINQVEHE